MNHIKIIGCGDAFGYRAMLNTCFLLETDENKYTVDFGATSMPGLRRSNLGTEDIDGIIITHFHGDHFGGIVNFLLEASLIKKREKPLWIVSPDGGEEKIKTLCEILYPDIYKDLPKDYIKYLYYNGNSLVTLNEIQIKAVPLIHASGSNPHGIKISCNGKTFGFSGDTELTEDLFSLSSGTDVFICESNYYDQKGPGHLRYVDIVKNLGKFETGRLYISHLGEDWTEDKIEKAELTILKDGDVIDL